MFIREGGTLEGFERGDLAGIIGILIGWANDSNLSNRLYYIIRRRANTIPQSRGDVILAVIGDEVAQLIEPPRTLDSEDIQQWEKLTRSSNPIYRHLTLKIYPHLTQEIDHLSSFLQNYSSETDPCIKLEALTNIRKLPESPKRSLLNRFREEQEKVGDLDFVHKIEQAISDLP